MMKIQFSETDEFEKRVNQHFDVSSNENIRNNHDTVEETPLFFRDFDLIFHEVSQNVFQV